MLRDAFQGGGIPLGNTSIVLNDEPQHKTEVPSKPKLKIREKEIEQPKAAPAPLQDSILQNQDLMYETIGIVENNPRAVADMLAYAAKVESSVCASNPTALRSSRECLADQHQQLENLLDLKQKHANGWRPALRVRDQRRRSDRET